MAEPDEILTVAEIAAELKMNQQTIRNMIFSTSPTFLVEVQVLNGGAPAHRPGARPYHR